MKNLYPFVILCFINHANAMEESIQHALCKINHQRQKTIGDLEYVIKQIDSDLASPPPGERFEVPPTWKSHMCLWTCKEEMAEIKAAVKGLHLATTCNNIDRVRKYLKQAPSLALFADEQGKTLFQKAQAIKSQELMQLLKPKAELSS